MENKAKQKLNEFIEKNLAKEKDKFAIGSKNNYYEWQELKDDLKSNDSTIDYLNEQIEIYQKFIQDMNLSVDFRKWNNNQGND